MLAEQDTCNFSVSFAIEPAVAGYGRGTRHNNLPDFGAVVTLLGNVSDFLVLSEPCLLVDHSPPSSKHFLSGDPLLIIHQMDPAA